MLSVLRRPSDCHIWAYFIFNVWKQSTNFTVLTITISFLTSQTPEKSHKPLALLPLCPISFTTDESLSDCSSAVCQGLSTLHLPQGGCSGCHLAGKWPSLEPILRVSFLGPPSEPTVLGSIPPTQTLRQGFVIKSFNKEVLPGEFYKEMWKQDERGRSEASVHFGAESQPQPVLLGSGV